MVVLTQGVYQTVDCFVYRLIPPGIVVIEV
jgi:hypothetical protein